METKRCIYMYIGTWSICGLDLLKA